MHLPPITSRSAAHTIWSKTSHARRAIRRITTLCALTTRWRRRRWRRRCLHLRWRGRSRWHARFSGPHRTISSVLGVYATGKFPFHILDDVVFVAVGVAVDGREGVDHDVDVAGILYHGHISQWSRLCAMKRHITLTYWSSNASPMYMSICLPVTGSLTRASRPQYFCVAAFQAVGLELYV
jgi:hypothetical protein